MIYAMTFVRSRNGENFRQSVIMPSKGLRNNPGENNCFMNSAVQVFWHLDVFRRSFRLLVGHTCLEECCIFCALKEIFEQFQESDEAALPPDVLRYAMAKAFQDQRKFQIGRMGDAAECFENILRRLHYHIAYGESEDSCQAKHCIPHQKFAMEIHEQTFCKCGASSQPFNFFQSVNYVVASTLIDKARRANKNGYRPYSFGELLKATSSLGESRTCPNEGKCAFKDKSIIPTKIHRTLLNCPDIVGIGITWDTDRPSTEYVMDVLDCLGKRLQIKDMFDSVVDERAKRMRLKLVGIMTYYGKHYTTFVYNSKQDTWFYLDDARVKEVGRHLDLVKERCFRGRHQPLLVFYANQDGEPIDSTWAPQGTKVVSQEELLNARFMGERTRGGKDSLGFGKDSVGASSPKQKGRKSSPDKEEREQDGPAKRKSFSKLFGSAFGRTKSVNSKSGKGRKTRYSGDHVLSVNGQDNRQDREFPERGLDEQQVRKNCYAEEDVQGRRKTSGGNMIDRSLSSPSKLSDDKFVTMNGTAQQTQRLQKHQQHLKSLGPKLEATGDPSDYDGFERPIELNAKPQKTRKSSEMFVVEARRGNELSPVRTRDYSNENKIEPGVQESHHQHRRIIDQGDTYADTIDQAESLIVSSIQAEQEGNLVESFHLCNQANRRYKIAFGLQGITDKMRDLADKRFIETQNRTRLLSQKINASRERVSKPADFNREVSKTSDYGSLSDASGSPIAPAEYPMFSQKHPKANHEMNQAHHLAEKGGIQAKLNKERSKQETSKQAHVSTVKSLFFTLPRKKKNHKHKLSAPQPATQSEMQQLTDLLKSFDHSSQGNRTESPDMGGYSRTSRRSVSDLSSNYNGDQQTDRHIETSGGIYSSSGNKDLRRKTEEFVVANSAVISPEFAKTNSDNNSVHELSIVSQGDDRPDDSNSEVRNEKMPPLSKAVGDQRSFSAKEGDVAVETMSRNLKTPLNIYHRGGQGKHVVSDSKPVDNFYKTKDQSHVSAVVESKKVSKFTETLAMFKANAPKSADKQNPDSRISTEPKASIKVPDITVQTDPSQALEPSQMRTQASEANNNINNSLASKSGVAPAPKQSFSPKHAGKKKSFFQVVIPKIISADHILSSRKPKKTVEVREKEYETMLHADSGATASVHGHEAPRNDEIPKESQVADSLVNRSCYQMESKHEESYIVDPDLAQQEVAMVTNCIAEKRLFNDRDMVGISPRPETQNMHSHSRYNNRYLKHIEGNADDSHVTKANSSNTDGFGDVDVERSRGIDLTQGGSSRTPSPRKITAKIVSPASIAGRFSVDMETHDVNNDMLNNFIPNAASKPAETSSAGQLQDFRQSSRATDDRLDSLSKSVSVFSEYPQELKKVEPPPRNNPNVYKSSELYRPKTDAHNDSVSRSYPFDETNHAGTVKPTSHTFRGNTLSRWTNAVDFSKSSRQMCQQCGTVTVEKPRKFCRKCQSDYL